VHEQLNLEFAGFETWHETMSDIPGISGKLVSISALNSNSEAGEHIFLGFIVRVL
jgi:hypothetical protein